MCRLRLLVFHLYGAKIWLTQKLWLKITISWKFDFWQMGLLRLLIVHLGTKFGAKMLIDAQIMAKNRNSRWRLLAILDFRKPHRVHNSRQPLDRLFALCDVTSWPWSLTFWPWNHTTVPSSYQLWKLWDHSFLSYGADRHTDRQKDAAKRFTHATRLTSLLYHLQTFPMESSGFSTPASPNGLPMEIFIYIVLMGSSSDISVPHGDYHGNLWDPMLRFLCHDIPWILVVFPLVNRGFPRG